MPTHYLTPDPPGFPPRQFRLAWDDTTLTLTDPDGLPVFQLPTPHAHRILDLYTLDAEQKITFSTTAGPLTFRRNPDALRDLRPLILTGLRSDAEFRHAQRRLARLLIPVGLTATLLGGTPFTLYCVYASSAPDPPPGHWLYTLAPLIHLALLVLLALTLLGPYLILLSLRQLRQLRQAERPLPDPTPD